MSSVGTSLDDDRPARDAERQARMRRANVRLALVLGLVAAAVYVGFVITGLS